MRFTLGWSSAEAVTPLTVQASLRRRPRVGIALGAGAARGWALIGVLRELLANDFDPAIVAGTSMGAVVGGCYCAGRLDQLEAFALSLTKRRVFGLMDFTMSGAGLLSGGRLKAALDRHLGPLCIEDLPIRFASVATQAQTGHEIWLQHGDLVEAMRASYALPGVFEPVRIDGRWLIDGALVNPVPVSVCRALGADIVIAINLVTEVLPQADALRAYPVSAEQNAGVDLPHAGFLNGWLPQRTRGAPGSVRDTGPSIARVLVDAFNITQDRIARSRLAGDPPDLTINVKVGRIGLFEFHRAAEAIAIGREAARRSLPDLADIMPRSVPEPPPA